MALSPKSPKVSQKRCMKGGVGWWAVLGVAFGVATGVLHGGEEPLGKQPARPSASSALGSLAEQGVAHWEAGAMWSREAFLAARQQPKGMAIRVREPLLKALSGRKVARMARKAHLRVGWFYRCARCDKWHTNLAGGYALDAEVVMTAWHVTNPPADTREAFPVVVDGNGMLRPVKGVVCGSEQMDAIGLWVPGAGLEGVPLSGAEVGDAAYCFSDPMEHQNYFAAGIVNRLSVLGDRGGKAWKEVDPGMWRMNVSTDWAPGSSGSAVFDGFGNVMGHVATIKLLGKKGQPSGADGSVGSGEGKQEVAGAFLTMHEAIPAEAILRLLKGGPGR